MFIKKFQIIKNKIKIKKSLKEEKNTKRLLTSSPPVSDDVLFKICKAIVESSSGASI